MRLFIFFILISPFFGYNQVSDFKHINFTKAENTVKRYQGASLKNLPILAHNLTSHLETDAEKFRAIFLWVCENIAVDAQQGNKVLYKRKKLKNDSIAFLAWNKSYLKKTYNRLFKKQKTMCSGFAYLVKELCFFANIECEIINGYARTASSNVDHLDLANHSWNAVKLNNKWYLSDAIWASGYTQDGVFIKDYNDGYFLTEPILFAKNHYPINKKWFLNSTLEKSEFKTEPIVYGDTFKYGITPIYPKKLHTKVKKSQPIIFKIKSKDLHNNIKLVQRFGNNEIQYKIENQKTIDNTYSFTTVLKFKGHYDLHLTINDAIVATYTFTVTK